MPRRYPEDVVLSHPATPEAVADVVKLLKQRRSSLPKSQRKPNKIIYYELTEHAKNCPICDGHISESLFEKAMTGNYAVRETPSQIAIQHAIEGCYGIRTNIQQFLINRELVPDPRYWPEQADEFDRAFANAMTGARELIGWAKFLPCSLETPHFIQAHHAALFRDYSSSVQTVCVDLYNRIGLRHCERFTQHRAWHFWHLMLLKDIEAIADGKKEYKHVTAALRRECLTELLIKVSTPAWKVRLVVAEELPPDVKAFFSGLDSAVCVDDHFVFRREQYYRTLIFNTDRNRVAQFKGALNTFTAVAQSKETSAVEQLLRGLIASIPQET